jgi:hypothetical protein
MQSVPVDPSSDLEISDESDDDDDDPAVEIASSISGILVSGEVDIMCG